MTPFDLKIITPEKIFFEGNTEQIIVRTVSGDIGILAGHAPYVANIVSSPFRIKIEGEFRTAAISGGLIKVSADGVTVVTSAIEWADEIDVARAEKEKAGAKYFLTQPVYDDKDIESLKYIKSFLSVPILFGVMPLVSYRNANFIRNELPGITIPDWVIDRFSMDMSKEEGEKVGLEIAFDIMEKVKDIADGYYFTIPFNRLSICEALLKKCC